MSRALLYALLIIGHQGVGNIWNLQTKKRISWSRMVESCTRQTVTQSTAIYTQVGNSYTLIQRPHTY